MALIVVVVVIIAVERSIRQFRNSNGARPRKLKRRAHILVPYGHFSTVVSTKRICVSEKKVGRRRLLWHLLPTTSLVDYRSTSISLRCRCGSSSSDLRS